MPDYSDTPREPGKGSCRPVASRPPLLLVLRYHDTVKRSCRSCNPFRAEHPPCRDVDTVLQSSGCEDGIGIDRLYVISMENISNHRLIRTGNVHAHISVIL